MEASSGERTSTLVADGQRLHRVVMVSDFFYPNFGGVENHIYTLSQCLISMGHKVVVITHSYGDCRGVRYLTNGLKVYYLPRTPFYQQASFPTLLGWARLLRAICVRERATLLHAHQAFSTMALEAALNGRSLGLKVVFTDHSLFGFADPASIVLNKILKAVLADVHAVICVSHTSKENTVLRACLPPERVAVIPNAVDASAFQPDPRVTWPTDPARCASGEGVVLVVLCRLVYRKGVDLLGLVLPPLCARRPGLRVLIGGDGPKRALLEKVISDHGLGDRVSLCGAVPHERARDFMVRGHVFVNASLTEAFCIALVEAAAAGLVVVSTAVGGVPEVLPPDMIVLAEPSAEGLLEAIERALLRVPYQRPAEQHERVRQMYNWNDVARRTVRVYDRVAASDRDDSLPARLRRYAASGRWVGAFFAAVALLGCLWFAFLDWWQPRGDIDAAPDWPRPHPTQAQSLAPSGLGAGQREGADGVARQACGDRPEAPPELAARRVSGDQWQSCAESAGMRGLYQSCALHGNGPVRVGARAGGAGVGGEGSVARAVASHGGGGGGSAEVNAGGAATDPGGHPRGRSPDGCASLPVRGLEGCGPVGEWEMRAEGRSEIGVGSSQGDARGGSDAAAGDGGGWRGKSRDGDCPVAGGGGQRPLGGVSDVHADARGGCQSGAVGAPAPVNSSGRAMAQAAAVAVDGCGNADGSSVPCGASTPLESGGSVNMGAGKSKSMSSGEKRARRRGTRSGARQQVSGEGIAGEMAERRP